MGATTLIPVELYLKTAYSPDREYVDGVVVERNLGEKSHSRLQRRLIILLDRKYPTLFVWPEFRMRTVGERYRIPDLCITLSEPQTEVLLEAPFVAIEILSPEDTMSRVREKLKEYAAIGIPNIWLFDPQLREMFVFQGNALLETDRLSTPSPVIELTREEVFQS
jgi:Uma2 family endonuclease